MELIHAVLYAVLSVSAYAIYHEFAINGPYRRRMHDLGCQPPPRDRSWYLLFGIDFLLARSRHVKSQTWLEYSKRYFHSLGLKTFQLNILNRSIIYTIDPDNLKAIHVTNYKSWGMTPSRKQRVVPLIGDGVFTKDGHGWSESRKLLRPSFERSQLMDLSFLEDHVTDLISRIPKDGSTVDLQFLFYTFTMNTASEFLLGDRLGADSGLKEGFEAAFDRCLSKVGGAGKFQAFASKNEQQYDRDRRLVHAAVDRRVEQAVQQAKGRPRSDRHVFLDNLIAESNDRERVRSELLNNLMAGRDTTASLLSSTWFHLARNPSIWSRLREEVKEVFKGEKPSHERSQELPYLRAVFNESMRMYPQIPENGRIALEDTVLPRGGGKDNSALLFVPKGQVAMWGNYVLQRDPDVYGDDADEYRPERWLAENGSPPLKPGFAYLPFGAGPRQCMGQQFALKQASYLTVRLLQVFSNIQNRSPGPWREKLNLVLAIEGGCPVALS